MSALETAAPAAAPPAPPAPEETTAAVPPAGETIPTEQPAEGAAAVETPEPETEPNLEDAPESSGDFAKYKPLFKDHPELRNIIGREQAYSSLGNFSEVREIVQRIPTVDDAEQLVADSENKRMLAKTFREDVPSFVESLKESDPFAFQKFAAELPEVLAQTDEKLFSEQSLIYTNRFLTNAAILANNGGDAELLTAIQRVAQAFGARIGTDQPAVPRETSEASRLRKQIAERDQADAEAKFNSFYKQTDQIVRDEAVSSIETLIKKSFPAVTQDQLNYMVPETHKKMLEMLQSQPQTTSRMNSFVEAARSGKQGIADQNAMVKFYMERANIVIPKAAKSVIDHWSKKVLKIQDETIEKRKTLAANTKDVGSGPQGTTSVAAPASAGNGKARHVTDILTEIANGTYKPR